MRSRVFLVALAAVFVPGAPGASPASAPHAQQVGGPADAPDIVLKPTEHPRLPAELSAFWLAPSVADLSHVARAPALNELAAAVKLEIDSDFARALPILSQPFVQQGALGEYALYYQGLAELRLGRPANALKIFQAVGARPPFGYLLEATALREGECEEAMGDQTAALEIYERLSNRKTTAPDDVLMRVGRAAKAVGNTEKAIGAYSRVVYEYPFSDAAPAASAELDNLPIGPIVAGSNRYALELGRAERLFGAKRYALAQPVFDALRRAAQGDDRELVDLRIAECDYFLKRPRNARDGVRPYLDHASRRGEALFFYAVAIRDLGDETEYQHIVRRLADEFTTESWAEEALNNLATHDILDSDDESADAVFREMYEKFPTGRYAERAAWKIGWRAYRAGRFADTVRAFESAAAHFPRSDYRPSWLYWSARAHDALKETDLAQARYSLLATDYLNSYYGRLAVAHLGGRVPERRVETSVTNVTDVTDVTKRATATNGAHAQTREPRGGEGPAPAGPLPPNGPVVRALLAVGLYDQAMDELRYAQRLWGDSPAIEATFGWVYRARGDLRAGINAMKRAYPQYLAAGGEEIPAEILKVRFPVNYWALIKRYSAERSLDPYLMAALIAQESTFTADAKSSANAYGLMQLLPSTGRQYARTLGLSRFNLRMLTTAEPNIRMGTAYFADLVRHFGGVDYALATYNAGPNRVARWIAEKPGVERDEFIDDIPFPQTQDYVRKILGQAEDYRRLYGPGSGASDADVDATPAVGAHADAAPAQKAAAPPKPAAKKAASRKAKKTAA
jgi:soluble lytic murein transglycosylase